MQENSESLAVLRKRLNEVNVDADNSSKSLAEMLAAESSASEELARREVRRVVASLYSH